MVPEWSNEGQQDDLPIDLAHELSIEVGHHKPSEADRGEVVEVGGVPPCGNGGVIVVVHVDVDQHSTNAVDQTEQAVVPNGLGFSLNSNEVGSPVLEVGTGVATVHLGIVRHLLGNRFSNLLLTNNI